MQVPPGTSLFQTQQSQNYPGEEEEDGSEEKGKADVKKTAFRTLLLGAVFRREREEMGVDTADAALGRCDRLNVFPIRLFCSIWMYLNIFECIWMYLNVFECIWMYLNVFECIWMYLNVFECIWMYLNVFECIWLNVFECIWMYLNVFECIWMYLNVFIFVSIAVSVVVSVVVPPLLVAVAVAVAVAVVIIIVVKAVISSSRPWLEPLALKLQHFPTPIADDG